MGMVVEGAFMGVDGKRGSEVNWGTFYSGWAMNVSAHLES
jgi:hypothetical protein